MDLKKNNLVFLLPPSEGKNMGGSPGNKERFFAYQGPDQLLKGWSEKDLKCTGNRFDQAMRLNSSLGEFLELLPAIKRYSGVMYTAIGYESFSENAQTYFQSHVAILSGYYGVLRPSDLIENYKLPIEAKGLYAFWKGKLEEGISSLQGDIIIDVLPGSYKKMLRFSSLRQKVIHVDFYERKLGEVKKLTHSVKKIKGQWIQGVITSTINCEMYLPMIEQISENEYQLDIIIES